MLPSLILHIIWFILLLPICMRTHAELFTATAELEYLLETRRRLIDDLDIYVNEEEKRLFTIKRILHLYKTEHMKAIKDIPDYLGNPINAFTLIKSLTIDLDYIADSIDIGAEYLMNVSVDITDIKYPTPEDLIGAAQGLIRLQDMYHLDVKEIADGKLKGVAYSSPMTAGDCYELARVLYNESDFMNAKVWMMEAYRKYSEEKIIYPFTEIDILDYISFIYYMLGDLKNALKWTQKMIEIEPEHARAKDNVLHYEKSIAKGENKSQKIIETEQEQEEELTEQNTYEALCRGDMEIPAEISRSLICRYMTENHPFLKIAPLKMEMMYLNPDIVIFHDVISDDEIETIKQMARPRFKRAVVRDYNTGEPVVANFRISKSAWLLDTESKVVASISRRVADMTGLSMETAEELQVANYGIGGHYEPHYDFARKSENPFSGFEGNRIATVIFYLSDVAQGGATVFTELGVRVLPVKGAAAFWLNLHPSGEGDFATRHGACPVLQGSKWVCNKWIHEVGQEFLKPCNLEYQVEGILRKIPQPVQKKLSLRLNLPSSVIRHSPRSWMINSESKHSSLLSFSSRY